jgi:hypothetical protein
VSVANPYDVASRLAEGLPAVADIEEYVAACQRLGYRHPDLTAHPAQVRDHYASEDGLDLRALDGDCDVLSAVASGAQEAARMQTALVAELSTAWSGAGAVAAREFASRSAESAGSVSSAIRTAADAVARLRDALWHAVDTKVAAVEAIDGRHRAQRAEWLAAATTVTGGTGDLAAASEMVDQQVKPFVAGDIGTDWLAAMRTAAASISGAYDAALTSTAAAPRAVFDVPGELGPRPARSEPATGAAAGGPAQPMVATVPAAAAVAPAPAGPATTPWSGVAQAVPPAFADPAAQEPIAAAPAALPPMPSTGDLGAGASSLGTGLSRFGQQLADLIGSLVGSSGGPTDPMGAEAPDLPDGDAPELDEDPDEDLDEDPDDPDDDPDDGPDEDPEAQSPDPEQAGQTEAAQKVPEACGGPDADGPAPDQDPGPTVVGPPPDSPPPPPLPPQPVPDAVADAGEPTPCEIAADELPQVGE